MPQIKIYSTSTCPYCHAEKAYLEQRGVEFEEVLLDQHPEQIKDAIDACGSRGVPCTHITKDDGSVVNILGFDQPAIDAALGLS